MLAFSESRMRRAAALILPALAVPLAAQAAMVARPDSEGASTPNTLVEWVAKVKQDGWAQWVLLSGVSQDWTGELKKTLDSDPFLLETGIGQWVIPQASMLGKELCARERWSGETRWALVDKDGSVLDSGTTLPSAEFLKSLVERRGIQGPIQVLTAFLGSHPDRMDALSALLGKRVFLARTLMKPYLTYKKPPVDGGGLPQFPDPPSLSKPLPEGEDERIWGPVARLMGTGERAQSLKDLTGVWSLMLRMAGAGLSPTMQQEASRCLPQIEDGLRARPDDYDLWSLWVRLQEVAGGRPLRPLLDSLTPLPLPNSKVIPDEFSLSGYIYGAKRANHWRDIVDLVQPWWNDQREHPRRFFMLGRDGKPMDTLEGDWDRLLSPLVEAYLRQGQGYEADRVVREAMEWRPSAGLPRWASELARRCGDEQSAAQWARMTVPKTGPQ